MARLTGDALLAYVRDREGADRDEIIEGAGYVVRRGDKTSLQRVKFFEALSQAQGLDLGAAPVQGNSKHGPRAGYRIKVGAKGLVPISAAYTKQVGLVPGSYATVEIDDGAIVLYPEGAYNKAEACEAPRPVVLDSYGGDITPPTQLQQLNPMAAMVAA